MPRMQFTTASTSALRPSQNTSSSSWEISFFSAMTFSVIEAFFLL